MAYTLLISTLLVLAALFILVKAVVLENHSLLILYDDENLDIALIKAHFLGLGNLYIIKDNEKEEHFLGNRDT